jgi:hypothetical protein
MLLAVTILKAIVEIALFALLAQAILFVFAGASRDRNIVYRIFATITRPVQKATRVITPRFIVDAHLGFVSFFLLGLLWCVLVLAKIYFYLELNPASS